jgi:two-component system response regulator
MKEVDVLCRYDCGANSFITKPATFDALAELIKSLGQYWLEIVELPDG